MDWIQGIQRAIDYVEAHITEEIDFEEVGKQAYSSSFHFQRVFGILCGLSLGDYIRMRRLSLAEEELSKGKMPDAFIETYNRIVTEFFPQSTQYEYAENVEFEVYSSNDVSNPNYQCEIWIAVKEETE